MTKEKDNLCTSNLQFSFKPGASTAICTGMVQEPISYYVSNESNVMIYCLMLAKLLIMLTTVNYSDCWIEMYVPFTVDCFLLCILIKS